MARPPGLPKFDFLGDRVRWWREHKNITREDLAEKAGIKYTTLASLENNETKTNRKSHLIAAALGLNPHYMETDKGEPEAAAPQEPPAKPEEWPFPAVPRSKIKKLNKIERSYLETEMVRALNDIENERRNKAG